MADTDAAPTPEPLPAGSREAMTNGEQGALDYTQMSVEELEQQFRDGQGETVEDPGPPPPEPEAPAEEPAEAAPEEAPAEEAPEAAEAAPEAPAEEEFDERESQLEEMRLQLKKMELDNQRLQDLTDRRAGQYGSLLEQLKQQATETVAPRREEDALDDDYETRPAPTRTPVVATDPVLQQRVAELESERNQVAVESVFDDFLDEHDLFISDDDANPDAAARNEQAEATLEKMQPIIQERMKDYADLNVSGASLRKVVRLVLDSSLTEVRMQEIRQRRAEALERRVSQVAERNLAKQAAASTGSGSAPAPSPRTKRIEDMTAEEADAELRRLSGERPARR